MTQEVQCTHADTMTDTGPASQVCEPCVAAGDGLPGCAILLGVWLRRLL